MLVCGNEWDAAPYHLLNGRGCPQCAVKARAERNRYSDQQFKKLLEDKNPAIEPLEKYVNRKTRLLCRCRICGREWRAVPALLLQGVGCKTCANRKHASRKTDEEFKSQLEEKHPTIEALEKYVTRTTKIQFRCKVCGHAWSTTPDTLMRGKGCPVCRKRAKG